VDQLAPLIEYVRANPMQSFGVAVVVVGIYYLLNRKSRLVRDAERRIEELRRERADQYNKLRPPR
jgi:hypothetical protein